MEVPATIIGYEETRDVSLTTDGEGQFVDSVPGPKSVWIDIRLEHGSTVRAMVSSDELDRIVAQLGFLDCSCP